MEKYYVLCVENQEVFDLPDDYVGLFTNMKGVWEKTNFQIPKDDQSNS